MSPAVLFIIGFVIFLPVFVTVLSFAYSTGVRVDRSEDEAASAVPELAETSPR